MGCDARLASKWSCNPGYRPGTASSHWRLENQRERDSFSCHPAAAIWELPTAMLAPVFADGNTPRPAEAPQWQSGTLGAVWLQGSHPHL